MPIKSCLASAVDLRGSFQLGTIFSLLMLMSSPGFAAILSYDLSWTGDGGYSASGVFTFDDSVIGVDNLITEVDLSTFDISFFDPGASLLRSYSIGELAFFDFSFRTDTLLIDQGPASSVQIGTFGTAGVDFTLLRINGCTGDQMLLYSGTGSCASPPNQFLDVNGRLIASATNVPVPASLALFQQL
jgi:hypothetical protein